MPHYRLKLVFSALMIAAAVLLVLFTQGWVLPSLLGVGGIASALADVTAHRRFSRRSL